MNVFYIIGGFFVLQAIFAVVYFLYKKKKDIKLQNETYDRLFPIYNSPNIVKVALWINIDSVNGHPFDDSQVYKTKVKSAMTGMNTTVDVALLKPGTYDFIVTSREYSNVEIQAELEAGETYQLGADEDGPYLISDPNPARYELKKAD